MWTLWLLACTPSPPAGVTAPESVLRFDGSVPRNLLMLSLDTMRRDHLGRYREGPSLTPFQDELLEQAFVLDDVGACSNWTTASTTCVLSGATNLDRAVDRAMVPILDGRWLAPIPEGTPMLPTWLGEAGFRTVFVSTNGFFGPGSGSAQGFDAGEIVEPKTVDRAWEVAEGLLQAEVDAHPQAPWYLHLHFYEPHALYIPPPAYLAELDALPGIAFDLTTAAGHADALQALSRGALSEAEEAAVMAHIEARYRGEVRLFDDRLAALWDELDSGGWLDDTLVVFWTDHGEQFREHGHVGHAKLLHGEETDVVSWLWAPNLAPGVWSRPVHAIDLVPTLLDVHDLPTPPQVTGVPLGQASPQRPHFALADGVLGPVQAVEVDGLRLHFAWDPGRARTHLSLFDTRSDAVEQEDLFDPAEPSADARRLWDLLRPKVVDAQPWIADDPRGIGVTWPEGLPRE